MKRVTRNLFFSLSLSLSFRLSVIVYLNHPFHASNSKVLDFQFRLNFLLKWCPFPHSFLSLHAKSLLIAACPQSFKSGTSLSFPLLLLLATRVFNLIHCYPPIEAHDLLYSNPLERHVESGAREWAPGFQSSASCICFADRVCEKKSQCRSVGLLSAPTVTACKSNKK